MTLKPGMKDFFWMAAGAAALLAVILIALHFQTKQSPSELLAFKAKRVDLVARMRLHLASASEAEKSAVLAITDQDSQTFADQARATTKEVEQEKKQLEILLTKGGTQEEKILLAKFSKLFADFQHIDNELLSLAVKNTNIKAYSLAFGPAADAIKETDAALSRIIEKNTASLEAKTVMLLACTAQTSALRIQALLAPHIAEERDEKMAELEARMAAQDLKAHKALAGLSALQGFSSDLDLKAAVSGYTRFSEIKKHILALSRENTNVHSLAMSLGQKRETFLLCQEALSSLQQAIMKEPLAGIDYGAAPNPRSL
jgi:hypothetical protein